MSSYAKYAYIIRGLKMANKTYRTANGKTIDMENLILKNAKVRAVGNMNVNARGDVIDSTNETTSQRSAQVNRSYRKQTGNVVKDQPVVTSKKAEEEIIVGLDDTPVPAVKEAKGGLADAIAKTKKTKKEK